jgi:hypothetical protein
MSGIRPRETKTSEERGRPERHRTGIIPPEKNAGTHDEISTILEKWSERGQSPRPEVPEEACAMPRISAAPAPTVPPAPKDNPVPEPSDEELAALEAWMQDETVPPGPHGALADLPPLPKQPGMGASEEEVEAYRQAQIRRLKLLGLCERKEGGGLKRGIGPPRAGPYEPRRPPLSPEEAKAELKRRGLW